MRIFVAGAASVIGSARMQRPVAWWTALAIVATGWFEGNCAEAMGFCQSS